MQSLLFDTLYVHIDIHTMEAASIKHLLVFSILNFVQGAPETEADIGIRLSSYPHSAVEPPWGPGEEGGRGQRGRRADKIASTRNH